MVRSITAANSRDVLPLQLADLLVGAVGYHWNDLEEKPDASPAKAELAGYIASRLGRRTLKFASARDELLFNVWKFRLR